MNRKIIAFLLALLTCMALAFVSSAESEPARVVDGGDLLSPAEESALESKIYEIRERQQFDIVIVTIPALDGADITAYADDYYDYNGYGYGDDHDGVLLLVSVGDRECWMSTTGYGITAFTDGDIDYILDEFAEEYGDENYAEAFDVFVEICDEYVTISRESEEYDPVFTGGIALVIGLIIALIATGIMKGQLKSVRYRSEASDYTKAGSLQITESRDFFLYRTVSRREKPKENSGSSTHTSSSGRSHGGGGHSL